jgi:hypothetical protein
VHFRGTGLRKGGLPTTHALLLRFGYLGFISLAVFCRVETRLLRFVRWLDAQGFGKTYLFSCCSSPSSFFVVAYYSGHAGRRHLYVAWCWRQWPLSGCLTSEEVSTTPSYHLTAFAFDGELNSVWFKFRKGDWVTIAPRQWHTNNVSVSKCSAGLKKHYNCSKRSYLPTLLCPWLLTIPSGTAHTGLKESRRRPNWVYPLPTPAVYLLQYLLHGVYKLVLRRGMNVHQQRYED